MGQSGGILAGARARRCPGENSSAREYKEERNFPKHATFGDRAPILDESIESILATLAAEETTFPWQAGDVMLCDNHRIAHCRRPYTGERQVLVTLA